MVIFFKKGNRKDIKNYRPICLLSNMYKLFTKIITTRLEKKLDENQPREQAGFRSKYSTTDHIHAINQLKEKCREYNIPLCVAFVDYEKAFDSVQTQAILTSLQEQGIEDVYIEILKDIYTDSSVTVHLHKESEKIRIKRGVRQGDTISPKLFTATLESIRQTPGYLQKQPCHLPEKTSVQLLCAASYDIWCRDLDTDQTSTEQTCGRTDQNGKKYAQHHIQR